MNQDTRLKNLLFDSELLLIENAPIDNFVFKPPTKLRKIFKEQNVRNMEAEPRPRSAILLNINFPELEKSVEATKNFLKVEPVIADTDISYFSYFPLLHRLTLAKTDHPDSASSKAKDPSLADSKTDEYLKYIQARHLDEVSLEPAINIQASKRSVATAILKSWDNKIERIMDSTLNAKDQVAYDPQQVNIYLPFVTRKMEKIMDTRKFAYINHVYHYVQMSRIYERPRARPEMASQNVLQNLSGHYNYGDSYEQGRSRFLKSNGNMQDKYFGASNANIQGRGLYFGQDSFSLGGSISEELQHGGSKLGYTILPRPEKAKLIMGLLDEFSILNQNSKESSLYLILKELFRNLDFGSKDPSISKKELSITHINELLDQSCRILQAEFFEQAKRMAKRRKLELSTLNGRQIETVQIIFGYIEEYVLNEYFSMQNIVIRDEDGLPVWTLLFYMLRAGLTNEFEIFCEEYRGSLLAEVRHLFTIYRDKKSNKQSHNLEIRTKFESDAEGFGLSEFSDIFKRTLAGLLGGSDELADTGLLSEIKDFLWFNLYRSYETDTKNPKYLLLDLQRKIQATEKEFIENGEVVELAKIQLLTLMFSEAVESLHRVPGLFAEAAQLCFITKEARLIKLQKIHKSRDLRRAESQPHLEDILLKFAEEIAHKFPIEAIAYLCAVENPTSKAKAIKYFMDKNDLLPLFFNTTSDSAHSLERLKSLLSKEAYDSLLAQLTRRSALDGELLTISYIRVLEESQNITEILKLIILQEYLIVQKLRTTSRIQTPHFAESLRYLEKLYNDNSNKTPFISNNISREVMIARNIRMLFSLYYEKKNPKYCMEIISAQKFFEIEFKQLSNKLKILFLEMIVLALTIFNEYKDSLRLRALSYDSSLRHLRSEIGVVENYFYGQVAGSPVVPEPPFDNFDGIERQIKDLIGTLNATH